MKKKLCREETVVQRRKGRAKDRVWSSGPDSANLDKAGETDAPGAGQCKECLDVL